MSDLLDYYLGRETKLQVLKRILKSCYKVPIWKVKRAYRRIETIVNWVPIIWKDEPYDYCFMLYVLEHKAKTMLAFWNSDRTMTSEEHSIKVKQELQEVLEVCNRLIEHNYNTVCLADVKTKYGRTIWENAETGEREPPSSTTYRWPPLYKVVRPISKILPWVIRKHINNIFIRIDVGFKANIPYHIVAERVDDTNKEEYKKETSAAYEKARELETADYKRLGELLSGMELWWD